jgi:hypothetical protein
MRKFSIFLAICVAAACGSPARAQYLGQTSPQTVTQVVFNGVSSAQASPQWDVTKTLCTPVAASACGIQNLGQNIHFLTYTTTAAAVVQLRLEGSNDGTHFFQISDDAVDPNSGEVFAIGWYPVIRANLVSYVGTGTLTAQYSGTSSTNGPPLGIYNPSQTSRKVLWSAASVTATQTGSINCPTGSTLGYLIINQNTGSLTAGGTITLTSTIGSFSEVAGGVSIPATLTAGNATVFPIASSVCSNLTAISSTAGTGTFSAFYVFVSPGSANGLVGAEVQAPQTQNSELVSSANTLVEDQLTNQQGTQRNHLYSVSARCSAGTAQLTVIDNFASGPVNLFTSAPTEVGTTTFKFQWVPGLAAAMGDQMLIKLSACGAGNIGTLDVQSSVF